MGCFSFLCKRSGKPALSTSFNGSPVYMFLLKDGVVVEEMYGNYDSYGKVFTNELRTDVKHELYNSFQWSMDWNKVCNLIYNGNNSDGIAIILEEYYDGTKPSTQSLDDPNQGWGDDGELLLDTGDYGFKRVKNPYHKVFHNLDIDKYNEEYEKLLDPLEKFYDQVYAELALYDKEIEEHNDAILKSIGGRTIKKWFNEILDGCDLDGKLEIVDKPIGDNQKESYGVFKEIWVDQYPTGTEGDTYAGHIYAKFNENKWLKIPYKV